MSALSALGLHDVLESVLIERIARTHLLETSSIGCKRRLRVFDIALKSVSLYTLYSTLSTPNS